MKYPEFFDRVEKIKLYDPLADFLGAVENGEMEICYLDVVKFAGHSCPTVAGAYLMAMEGLKKLYRDTLPVRGEVAVMVQNPKTEGVTGVIGNTIAFICGVNDESGFKGIGGRFSRAGKLHYSQNIPKEIRLQRVDTKDYVDISYTPAVAPDPRQQELMQKSLGGIATKEEEALFRRLWQERVERILTDLSLRERMIDIS